MVVQGKRVAVVGSGASAIQVIPAIASQVKQLTVFQRSPTFIFPRGDFRFNGTGHASARAASHRVT
jgi:cation diffusion facilitator CzcD-associated flavoprotein CzcO